VYGTRITPLQQAARLILGQRIQTLDVMNQVMFDSYAFTRDKRSIEEDFTSLVGRAGPVSEAELTKAYANMERKRQDLYRKMTDKTAKLELLGKTRRTITQTLSAGMSDKDFKSILVGRYIPYQVSTHMLQKAKSVSSDRFRAVINVIQKNRLSRKGAVNRAD